MTDIGKALDRAERLRRAARKAEVSGCAKTAIDLRKRAAAMDRQAEQRAQAQLAKWASGRTWAAGN